MKKKPTSKPTRAKGRTVHVTLDEAQRRPGATDWDRVRRQTDAEIAAAAAADPDAAPILDADWFAAAKRVEREPKQAVSIRVDRSVLDWFRSQGPGYLSRMNAVLRAYKEHHARAR
jgi:uncharacterized protein (DUF4415 family)